jgi:dipeptide transport system ATP-binding protein
VIVLYLGKIVENGPRKIIFENPLHPYTKALLASAPHLKKKSDSVRSPSLTPLKGELPSPLNPPSGCAFHKRCPVALSLTGEKLERCQNETPLLQSLQNRKVACHWAPA